MGMRTCALAAVLLLPVGAETLGQEAIRSAGYTWVPCSQLFGPDGSECRVNGKMIEVRQNCQAKMREAMRVMDRMQAVTLGEWANNKELREKVGKPGMELWTATMRECAEGK